MSAILEQPTLEELQAMSVKEQLEMCGVRFRADGEPILYSHNEVFGTLAERLVGFYGENIRPQLNESLVNHNLSAI
ncbi:MAG: hypothetical protein FWC39_06545 [Bacteroidetes bacterium]|nr:hypothetical protein [Bacteroidota bacterium]MCL2328159.1 hypothetical protein [Bacteroidota bacterium]